MICSFRKMSCCFFALVICLLLSACSQDSPWRYSPAAPDQPIGLTATSADGQVFLSWPVAANAAAYTVYYSTTPGVSKTSGTKSATVFGISYTQAGLANNTTYYFAVTSVNSSGESVESNQVSATPAALGSYVQSDLNGTWNFTALVSGTAAGWMHGSLVIDAAGAVAFSSFVDNTGNTQPPAYLFRSLLINSVGHVQDTAVGSPNFHGVVAANRNMIVGAASPDGTSQLLAILQKQVPGVTFSNVGDLQGFGNAGGGGRRFIYNQISSGSSQEWEFAAGQIGRDQKTQYTTFVAPSNPTKPGDKASLLNVSTDGIVTESLTGAVPQPSVVIGRGVMSADKSVIIGVATDSSGTVPRYILRIYQFENIISADPNSFSLADLAGTYDFQTILVGIRTSSASGTVSIATSGSGVYSSYTDSFGSGTVPPEFGLTMDVSGRLANPADQTFLGKLSYFKDMFVATGTDSSGICTLSIALKR